MRFSTSLKENYLFRRLYTKGTACANRYLVMYFRKNGTAGNRIGITVGKKVGHAVVRNRVRRRLREIYRLNEEQFRRGIDVVVVARSRAAEADFSDLRRAYLSAAKRLGILQEDGK